MKKTILIITSLLFYTSVVFPQAKVNVNSLKEIAKTNLINATADSLADMIYKVQYNLDELDRNVSQRFTDNETDIAHLEDDFNSNRRKTSQTLPEIQQSITLLQIDINEIKVKISEKDKKKKKK